MSGRSSTSKGDTGPTEDGVGDRPERAIDRFRKRLPVVVSVSVLVALIDYAVLRWAVPWADENHWNIYGSAGFVFTFITVLFTFIVGLIMVAYVFSRDSYPHNRWL